MSKPIRFNEKFQILSEKSSDRQKCIVLSDDDDNGSERARDRQKSVCIEHVHFWVKSCHLIPYHFGCDSCFCTQIHTLTLSRFVCVCCFSLSFFLRQSSQQRFFRKYVSHSESSKQLERHSPWRITCLRLLFRNLTNRFCLYWHRPHNTRLRAFVRSGSSFILILSVGRMVVLRNFAYTHTHTIFDCVSTTKIQIPFSAFAANATGFPLSYRNVCVWAESICSKSDVFLEAYTLKCWHHSCRQIYNRCSTPLRCCCFLRFP